MTMRKAAVLFLLIALIACGGGGGSDSSTPAATWTGPVNAAGYPDVAGAYSFNMAAGSVVCSDGATDTITARAMNLDVLQTDNRLSFNNPAYSAPAAGWTILQHDAPAGNIELDGNFVVTQYILMKTNTDPGNYSLNYTIDGLFTQSGWSGTYQLKVYNDFYKASCTYSADFRGDAL